MTLRNTPQRTLESWKQIAAYLDRSERTVRGWEAAEGLPVHRREHQKQDSVYAYRHEIDAWSKSRTRQPEGNGTPPVSEPALSGNAYLVEHDALTRTMHRYVEAARLGDKGLLRPALHPEATISGYCQDVEYSGSASHVCDWLTANGAAPDLDARFARIEIFETIALVHLDVRRWSGRLVGAESRTSDVFPLLKWNGEWKITHKAFHWYTPQS